MPSRNNHNPCSQQQSTPPGADSACIRCDFITPSCPRPVGDVVAEHGRQPAVPPHRFVKLLVHEMAHVQSQLVRTVPLATNMVHSLVRDVRCHSLGGQLPVSEATCKHPSAQPWHRERVPEPASHPLLDDRAVDVMLDGVLGRGRTSQHAAATSLSYCPHAAVGGPPVQHEAQYCRPDSGGHKPAKP